MKRFGLGYKKPFLLIEAIVAIALLSLSLVPLVSLSKQMFQARKRLITKMELLAEAQKQVYLQKQRIYQDLSLAAELAEKTKIDGEPILLGNFGGPKLKVVPLIHWKKAAPRKKEQAQTSLITIKVELKAPNLDKVVYEEKILFTEHLTK